MHDDLERAMATTLVWTALGLQPIETLKVGDEVYSRSDQHYEDQLSAITDTFGRRVGHTYRVVTESDQIEVTDEHPFWVQGKGWVEARLLHTGDVIASATGDELVYVVQRQEGERAVYNFSVE